MRVRVCVLSETHEGRAEEATAGVGLAALRDCLVSAVPGALARVPAFFRVVTAHRTRA